MSQLFSLWRIASQPAPPDQPSVISTDFLPFITISHTHPQEASKLMLMFLLISSHLLFPLFSSHQIENIPSNLSPPPPSSSFFITWSIIAKHITQSAFSFKFLADLWSGLLCPQPFNCLSFQMCHPYKLSSYFSKLTEDLHFSSALFLNIFCTNPCQRKYSYVHFLQVYSLCHRIDFFPSNFYVPCLSCYNRTPDPFHIHFYPLPQFSSEMLTLLQLLILTLQTCSNKQTHLMLTLAAISSPNTSHLMCCLYFLSTFPSLQLNAGS